MSDSNKVNQQVHLQDCGQIAMLAAFFSQADFDKKILDPTFRQYVLSQKNNILKILDTGFTLVSTVSDISNVSTVQPTDLGFVEPASLLSASSPKQEPVVDLLSKATSSQVDVLSTVRQICSEKTGYPLDFLESQLDLEADLGVDTIKQMEIVAAIREHFSLPKKEGFSLKDVPTIEKLSAFVQAQL